VDAKTVFDAGVILDVLLNFAPSRVFEDYFDAEIVSDVCVDAGLLGVS
jgi:hypothetical protein